MGQLVRLPRRDAEGDGAPLSVGDHASLGAIPATRAAKRFTMVSLSLRSPLRAAPAAFWCARTLVPSRNTMPSCTPRSCTRFNSRSQTPARAQRMKTWAARHHGPSSAGTARHLAPF